MPTSFFEQPILNSPYVYPSQHWELDGNGQPTQKILPSRRKAEFIIPIPQTKKQRATNKQQTLVVDEGQGLSSASQQYDITEIINEVRKRVDQWRQLPKSLWQVTPETARLLEYWRTHNFRGIRPFFCQVEAVETVIWLTEVAPHDKGAKNLLAHLQNASQDANPNLLRLALKLATGAGKTTVMALIIAWQTINAVRYPSRKLFSRGFLVVAPGLTIRDRLQVLQPHDPYSYYASRELVPAELLPEIQRAKIVITNYHAFKRRDRLDISAGGRALLQGRGPALETRESEGQMLQRVMPALLGMKQILVLNDEAHHCYRQRTNAADDLSGDEKKEAAKNNEAARLWISGLEAVQRQIGITRVLDLSATPFFLRGSGYAEGTLFPWTMCDFSLMDAIECGIVKLPRVPVADNIPNAEVPIFRRLWDEIRSQMPKKGRGKDQALDPSKLPNKLQTALEALYGHYKKTFDAWQQAGISVPPCFIVVCNNTATSKLIYDYIAGFEQLDPDGNQQLVPGQFELFRNTDSYGTALSRPRTILIDSEQLDSGEALQEDFHQAAKPEIERFRREIAERTGDPRKAEALTDQDLLREVMNTVGKPGRLGEGVRCVVSVSMLTEGWDANTVTHILGVRAFGTQLLCEQVIGRALRRQSYDLNADGLFDVEYADVLGIPFDFNAEPVVAQPQKPRHTTHIRAVRPERDALEIRFPRVLGYRVELGKTKLSADFTADSKLVLTPELVGPSITRNQGIIGEGVELTLQHTKDVRKSTVIYRLTNCLLRNYHDQNAALRNELFGDLKKIAGLWLRDCLDCQGGTYPAQLLYPSLADQACQRIHAAITSSMLATNAVQVLLDPYNPTGSTVYVNFHTSKTQLWETDPRRCQINYAVLDSGWEGEFCRVVESHPLVRAYVKNDNLGLEIPYRSGGKAHLYRPDYIVLLDDGHGRSDLLQLVVEIKGQRDEQDKDKRQAIETYWLPGVNRLRDYGRWAFAEFTNVYEIERELNEFLANLPQRSITAPLPSQTAKEQA
jgi:type III restriction enzyme